MGIRIPDSRPALKAEYQAGSQRHPTNVKSCQRSLRWCTPYPTHGEQSTFYEFYLIVLRWDNVQEIMGIVAIIL